MSAAFHVRADDDQRPGDRISVLMVVEFRFLTRCVIVGNLDAAIDDLCESAIMEIMNENQNVEEIRRYLRQGECDRLSPAYLPHNDCVRFKVAELEERAGCMALCLRFETAKKVESVYVAASTKVEKSELWDEDELWLSAVSWAIVADRGEIDLSSLSSSWSPVIPVPKTIILPPQWGDASICWYSALRECWTEAKLLPAQEELARDAADSASLKQMPQGSVPVQPIDSINASVSPPHEPGDISPSLNQSYEPP